MARFSLYEAGEIVQCDMPNPVPETLLMRDDAVPYTPDGPPPCGRTITPVAHIALVSAVSEGIIVHATQTAVRSINESEGRCGAEMDMLVNYGKGVVGRDSIDPNRHAIIMTTPDNGKTAALLGSQLTCAGLIVAHVEFPMLTRATRVIPKSARQRAAVLAITLFDVLVEKGF